MFLENTWYDFLLLSGLIYFNSGKEKNETAMLCFCQNIFQKNVYSWFQGLKSHQMQKKIDLGTLLCLFQLTGFMHVEHITSVYAGWLPPLLIPATLYHCFVSSFRISDILLYKDLLFVVFIRRFND